MWLHALMLRALTAELPLRSLEVSGWGGAEGGCSSTLCFELYHSPSCRCRFLGACLVLSRGGAVFQLQRGSFIPSLTRGSVFAEFCAVFLLDIAILLKPFVIVRTWNSFLQRMLL